MKQFIAIFLALISSAASADKQIVTHLTSKDEARLSTHRAVVEKYLTPEDLKSKYLTASGKLGALRALIADEKFKPDQTYELQSMGIVLGDAFVSDMGFHWVMVQDKNGRDPAIKYKNTSIILFPLTMLSKRLEKKQKVDVFELYNSAAGKVEELIRNGA